MNQSRPSRGEVWMVDLDPTVGHEQAGKRPAVVVSADPLNHGPANLAIIVPLTSRQRGIPFHVPIAPEEGGLGRVSYAKCEDIRSASSERLLRRMGRVTDATMRRVEAGVRVVLGL